MHPGGLVALHVYCALSLYAKLSAFVKEFHTRINEVARLALDARNCRTKAADNRFTHSYIEPTHRRALRQWVLAQPHRGTYCDVADGSNDRTVYRVTR